MKKKTFSIILAMVMCFALPGTVFATVPISDNTVFEKQVADALSLIDISKEIDNALYGVVDETVSQDIIESVHIESLYDMAKVSYTIKNLGTITGQNGNSSGTMYSVTAVMKYKHNNITEDNVYSYISLAWIDNFGLDNELVSVSGGWEANGRTLTNRQVWYGVCSIKGTWIDGLHSERVPSGDTFSYNAPSNYVGANLRAYSSVRSEGYPYSIMCDVRPTIFD